MTTATNTEAPKKKGGFIKKTGTGDGAKKVIGVKTVKKPTPVEIDLSKKPTNSAYLRAVKSTLAPVADSRKGLRSMMRTRQTLTLSHALAGIGTEIGEMIDAMSPYLLGNQLNPDMLKSFKDESGDLLYYAHLAARQVKAKLPSATRKIKVPGTPSELLLRINSIGVDIASAHKKMYYGLDLNQGKLRELISELVENVNALTWKLLNHAPADTMLANMAKLQERFKVNQGQFSAEAVEAHKAQLAQAAPATA